MGFYRVNYQSDMLTGLLQAVSDGSLDTRDRIQLIDDVLALVSSCLDHVIVCVIYLCYHIWKLFCCHRLRLGSEAQ